MSQTNKTCQICGELGHSKFYCKKRVPKPINKTLKYPSLEKGVVRSIDGCGVFIYKSKKITKPKKPSRSKLKKDLDKLVKDYVKVRDNYTCQWCGKVVSGKSCQGSHVFSVGSCSLLQFEPLNIKVLCAYCHRRRWHSSPPEAMAWFGKKFPERLAILEELKLTAQKKSTYELQMMIEEYKQKLKSVL